ncbi:SEC-C domain-containing protein [Rhodococcus sp. IEGM 1379]|uniref:SEC-C domain-containing protein n=1 Tax=Rhodococcus sp. IEGM 1379 TaxID=3047086 RepID=UPI0024B86D51|nr:SEC-C domain-containing protein [Rhodococcus sp. IEGM 1379]MDI9914104.1 SEC-C domain-containing protein [Rhodococcus sp. IEGM 1379]
MDDDFEAISAAALQILRAEGPLSEDALASALEDAGFGDSDEVLEFLGYLDDPFVNQLPDGRFVAVDTVLGGRVLTHRLRAEEIAADIMDADDVDALLMLASDSDPFELLLPEFDQEILEARGVAADADWLGQTGLVFPPGTFAEFVPGDLVALAVVDGSLTLRPAPKVKKVPAAVVSQFAALAKRGELFYLGSALAQLLVDRPTAFTQPTAPLTEIIEAARLDRHHNLVAPRGFDFAQHQVDALAGGLMERLELEPEDVIPVVMLLGLVEAVERGSREIDVLFSGDADGFAGLADGYVANAALTEMLFERLYEPALVEEALEKLIRKGPRAVRAAAYWMAGRSAEEDDRIADAEARFEQAIVADSAFGPALMDLARYASDRGDAVRGLSLLRRAGNGESHVLYDVLEHFQPVDRPGLGRNDKCWCGSGRKYKVCHSGKADFSLNDRARWLYEKARVLLSEPEWLELRLELAQVRAQHWPEGMESLLRAIDDPLVDDVVLFECRAFEEFVAQRGELLPADELMLAQQWLMVERSVHEVEAVQPGEGLTLRNVRTGDRHEVIERLGSKQFRVGNFVCARVVSVGDQMQFFGGIEPISAAERTTLIELLDTGADPAELVARLSARFAPPRIVTRDGEEMVACSAEFEIDDLTGIRRKLSRRYGKGAKDHWTWTVDGDAVSAKVNGSFRIEDKILVVDALNERRFETMLEVVHEIAPGSKKLKEERSAGGNMRGAVTKAQSAVTKVSVPSDLEDPEIVAVMDDYIRKYERTWLDDSIPALEGLTPRQAAADPTRRDDLVRLLNSFPQEERPGAMSVRRLKDRLGL